MLNMVQEKIFIEIQNQASESRTETEAFLAGRFRRYYQAELKSFMPNLLCLRDESGKIKAALGFKVADESPLFLENYLDASIESYLTQATGQLQQRSRIVEVGNLASVSAGGNRWLITALTAFLKGEGADWVVFTAQRPLLNSFKNLGIHITELAEARPDFMTAEERAGWGRYYEGNPLVSFGNVQNGFEVLRQNILQQQALQACHSLMLSAYAAGLRH